MHTVLRAAERADDGNCAKAVRLEDEHVWRRHASTSRWRSWARTHARFDLFLAAKLDPEAALGKPTGGRACARLRLQVRASGRIFTRRNGCEPGDSGAVWASC